MVRLLLGPGRVALLQRWRSKIVKLLLGPGKVARGQNE